MLQSLQDLNNQLKKYGKKLCILYGEPQIVLKSLIQKHKMKEVNKENIKENILLEKDNFNLYFFVKKQTEAG